MGSMASVWDLVAGLEEESNKLVESSEGVLHRAWALEEQRRLSVLNLIREVEGKKDLAWPW